MLARVQSVQEIEDVRGEHAFENEKDDRFAEQDIVKRHFAANDRRKGIVSENDGPTRAAHFHRRGGGDLVRSENQRIGLNISI